MMTQELVMTSRLHQLMNDPKKGLSLEELRDELNAIAQVRFGARLAFCKRLAICYLLIVGKRPYRGTTASKPFYSWCHKELRSANGKRYSAGTLNSYLRVGFAKNPEKLIQSEVERAHERRQATIQMMDRLGKAVSKSARVQLLESYRRKPKALDTSGDIADQVNKIMTVWERSSPQARAQFLYMVAGVRIAV